MLCVIKTRIKKMTKKVSGKISDIRRKVVMKELEQSDKLFVGVKEIVGSGLCSRNTLFDLMREDPTFPKGRKVGGTSNSPTKWYLPDIIEWLRGDK